MKFANFIFVFVVAAFLAEVGAGPVDATKEESEPPIVQCRCSPGSETRQQNLTGCGCEPEPNRYYKSINNANFPGAKEDCDRKNKAVVIIETEEELAAIKKMMDDDDDTASLFWVNAGYNERLGKFVWMNGMPVGDWVIWAPGHPIKDKENRLELIYDGPFNDIIFQTEANSGNARYICEPK